MIKTKLLVSFLCFLMTSFVWPQEQQRSEMLKELEKRLERVRLKVEDYPPPEDAQELEELFSFPSKALEEEDIYFYKPQRIAEDQSSNLYIIDNGRNEVFVFTPSGQFQKKFCRSGQGPGELIQPFNLVVIQNSLIISEVGNMRVQFLDFSGLYQKGFKISKGYYSMVANDDGLIMGVPISHTPEANLIEFLSPEGEVVASFGEPLDFKLSFRILNQGGLALSRSGEILFAFKFFPIIRKYSQNGDILAEFEIQNEIMKAKGKINLEGYELRLKNEEVAWTPAIHTIKTYKNKIYIMNHSPRLEILEIDNEGEIKSTFWLNVASKEGFSVADFLVLDKDNQIQFYILQRNPEPKVLVLGIKDVKNNDKQNGSRLDWNE